MLKSGRKQSDKKVQIKNMQESACPCFLFIFEAQENPTDFAIFRDWILFMIYLISKVQRTLFALDFIYKDTIYDQFACDLVLRHFYDIQYKSRC